MYSLHCKINITVCLITKQLSTTAQIKAISFLTQPVTFIQQAKLSLQQGDFLRNQILPNIRLGVK